MATKSIYRNKTIPQLLKIAVRHFHLYIRTRDQGQPCISCGSYNTSDASHYFSAGNHPATRFDENNVHLACRKCNHFLAGNLIPYRQNLIEKIGQERFDKLELNIQLSKRTGYKWDRFYLLEIIEKYKALNK